MAQGTPILSGEGPRCFNTSLCHTQLFSSKTTLHGRSKHGQSGLHTHKHTPSAHCTHSAHDNTSIISVAHSQTHIQTHRLRLHMSLALIKGRNVIDRGEIREKETERQRDTERDRERESKRGRRWLSHFSS